MINQEITACSGCDLLLEKQKIPVGRTGACPRCGSILVSPKKNPVERTLAVSLTGLFLYIPAIFFPLLTLDAMGMEEHGSIIDGFFAFSHSGYPLVAIVVLLTSVLLPLAKLLILFFSSFCLWKGWFPKILPFLLRSYHHLQEWGMDEVYLVGIFVTLIKIYDVAEIQYEVGFFAFIGLVFVTVCLSLVVDMDYFFDSIEKEQDRRVG